MQFICQYVIHVKYQALLGFFKEGENLKISSAGNSISFVS